MGHFYFRPEDDQWRLVRACPREAFDAAVVQARYIAPYPEGHARHGSEPRELADALGTSGVPWVIDLGTPCLCDKKIVDADGWARLRETDFARLFPLPLDWAVLEDPDARNAFVDAALAFQHEVPMLSAPYLEVGGASDPRHQLNIAMLRRVVGAAGERLAVGFVQMTLESLRRGLPAALARDYAKTGVKRIFLRVRNLSTESASAAQFRSYADGIGAFVAQKIEVVADQVGRLGPPAVAAGACGFSAGAQFFRTVPSQGVTLGGGGGGSKLPVELPGCWVAVPRDQVPAFLCPVSGCRVVAGDVSSNALREHNLHYLRHLALVADKPAALVTLLRGSGQPDAVAWADELKRRLRKSA